MPACPAPSDVARTACATAGSGALPNSVRSPPALKHLPSPLMVTATMDESAATSSSASTRASRISTESALRFAGRFRRSRRCEPSRSSNSGAPHAVAAPVGLGGACASQPRNSAPACSVAYARDSKMSARETSNPSVARSSWTRTSAARGAAWMFAMSSSASSTLATTASQAQASGWPRSSAAMPSTGHAWRSSQRTRACRSNGRSEVSGPRSTSRQVQPLNADDGAHRPSASAASRSPFASSLDGVFREVLAACDTSVRHCRRPPRSVVINRARGTAGTVLVR